MSALLIGVGVVLLLIAAFAGVYGRRQHRRRALVEDTQTTDVRDIRDEGRVELKGTIRSENAFDSPIRGDPAVLSTWEVEEWDERGSSDMWETRAEGVYATTFSLDDGTGSVTVDIGTHVDDTSTGTGIDDIQVSSIDVDRFLSTGVTVDGVTAAIDGFSAETTVPPDAEPPERIKEFVRGETSVGEQSDSITNVIDIGNAHGERRYYEGTLSPGDDVYVLGHARASDTATHPLKPDDVVIEPAEDETFIVSNKPEDELAETFGRYTYAYAIAAVLAIAGIAAIAYGAGLV